MSFALKASGAALVMLSCTAAGFLFALRLGRRRDFLRAFKSFLSALETNIRYRGDDIITLIRASAANLVPEFLSVGSSRDFADYWNSAIQRLPKSCAITDGDLCLLKDFGRLLGTTDTQGQLNHIALYREQFDIQLKKAGEEYGQKAKLYRILGFFAGAVAALLII